MSVAQLFARCEFVMVGAPTDRPKWMSDARILIRASSVGNANGGGDEYHPIRQKISDRTHDGCCEQAPVDLKR